MAHEITSSDSLFLLGMRAWHGLGTIVPDTGATMLAADVAPIAFARVDGEAGHWEAIETPAGAILADGSTIVDPDSKTLLRNDTREVLAIVGSNYANIGVAQAFAPFDPLVEAGILRHNTAGSFGGGRTIWICAEIVGAKTIEIGTGDHVVPHVLLSNRFGKGAATLKATATRVVCANTHRAAMLDGLAHHRVVHRGDVGAKLAAGVSMVENVRTVLDRQADAWRTMAATPADRLDLARYVAAVWQRPISEVIPDKSGEGGLRDFRHVLSAWDNPIGGKLATTDGTVWGLYQAATQVLSHGSPSSKKSAADRMESLQFNGGNDRLTRAEIVADLLASVGLGRAGLTWEDLQTKPTATLQTIVAASRAA